MNSAEKPIQATAASGDPLLSVAAAAREIGVSRQTLWRMHAEYGVIEPPVRISPGRVGYRRSTIEEYKNRGCA